MTSPIDKAEIRRRLDGPETEALDDLHRELSRSGPGVILFSQDANAISKLIARLLAECDRLEAENAKMRESLLEQMSDKEIAARQRVIGIANSTGWHTVEAALWSIAAARSTSNERGEG